MLGVRGGTGGGGELKRHIEEDLMVGLHGPTLGEGWWSESIYIGVSIRWGCRDVGIMFTGESGRGWCNLFTLTDQNIVYNTPPSNKLYSTWTLQFSENVGKGVFSPVHVLHISLKMSKKRVCFEAEISDLKKGYFA